MPNLQQNDFNLGWFPDADAENAPPGALLRADNLVLDETGAITKRKGSSKLDTSLAGGAAHSVRSYYLNTTLSRFAAVGDKLYRNGVDTGFTFDGSGDFAFGSDAYQVFSARGTTKKKYDGSNWHNWAIPAPALAPTLSAANAVTSGVATFASGESPGFTVTEGTAQFITDRNGVAVGATELTVDAKGQASTYKVWPADQDYLDVAGTLGGDTDLFDMIGALSNWGRVEAVTVMFGLNTGTDPFADDYFYFDWEFRDKGVVDLKSPPPAMPGIVTQTAEQIVQQISPEDITRFKTPDEMIKIKERFGKYGSPRSRGRRDAAQSSPAWFHYTVARSQFKRIGSTAGRDWKTVRGFKVIVRTTAGGTFTASFDHAIWYGGGVRALTGKFKALYVAARDTGSYVELSPPSPLSSEITLNQNGLNVTIPAAAISGLDPQVNQLWVFLFSVNLGGWYRFAVTGGTQTFSQSLDEFDPSGDGSIDAADRTRFTQWGLTIPGFTGSGNFVVTVRKSEDEALREGVALVPYLTGPPNDIMAIAGPYVARMFALTDEGWLYVSAQGSPSHFNSLHIQDLRRYGDPKWMIRTNGGIFIGMTTDVIHLSGSGDEDFDGNIDFFPEPLGIGNPPVDEAAYTDGNTIVYRAADGLMTLSGVTSAPVTQAGTSLLWRGVDRHGVQALNIETGRFRLAVDNHVLYMLAPEGSTTSGTTAIWRYDTVKDRWYRTTYDSSFYSIFRDPDGRLIAGDASGNVWLLEDGTQDASVDVAVDMLLPTTNAGQTLRRKTAHDLTLNVDTGGNTLSVDAYIDGSLNASAIYTLSTLGAEEHRQSIYGLADFSRISLRLRGDFSTFILRDLNISYRAHPQQRMSVDSGYILPPNGGDLAWLSEVELSVRSPVDLELVPIFDDVQKDALTVVVTPNVYSVYRVPLKRGQNKGRKPRLLLRTTNAAGSGNVGFELEWFRVRFSGSGNQTERVVQMVEPA